MQMVFKLVDLLNTAELHVPNTATFSSTNRYLGVFNNNNNISNNNNKNNNH